MKTKFELLECVRYRIKGTFENEPVEVVKTLTVTAISMLQHSRVNYRCHESYNPKSGGTGAEYNIDEISLIQVEPVVNAIASARAAEDTTLRNSGSLPLTAPAPASNDLSRDHPGCLETASQP
jgi:hypothetical protein